MTIAYKLIQQDFANPGFEQTFRIVHAWLMLNSRAIGTSLEMVDIKDKCNWLIKTANEATLHQKENNPIEMTFLSININIGELIS